MNNEPYSDFDSFEDLFEQAEKRLDYKVEGAKNDFTETVVRRMEETEVTRSELAERLGKQKPQITKLLRGNNNFTIETMVEIANALGCNYRSHLEPKECEAMWLNVTREKVSLQSEDEPIYFEDEMENYEIELEDINDGKVAPTA
jgi:transcriptional regulator with XRE-family HTH domain